MTSAMPLSLRSLLIASSKGHLRLARHWRCPDDTGSSHTSGSGVYSAGMAASTIKANSPTTNNASTATTTGIHAPASTASLLGASQSNTTTPTTTDATDASNQASPQIPTAADPQAIKPAITAFEQSVLAGLANEPESTDQGVFFVGKNKIAYKRYASITFMAASSRSESAFAMYSFIQVFVETLGKYFTSFSEYHIVFNLEKVMLVLDEMVSDGYVVETNRDLLLPYLTQLERQVSSLA